MKATQKELIDHCNGVGCWCNGYKCPYDKTACDAYDEKYKTIPYMEEIDHPERYTDEVIWSDEEAKKDD